MTHNFSQTSAHARYGDARADSSSVPDYRPKQGGLAERASVGTAQKTPLSKTVSFSRQAFENDTKSETKTGDAYNGRKSRATVTPDALAAVLDSFSFDYFECVIPNKATGKGICRVGGDDERRGLQDAIKFLRQDLGLRQGVTKNGGRGYGRGMEWHQGTETEACAFLTNGGTGGGMPKLTVKGGHGLAKWAGPLIQQRWPACRASRIDVALDHMDAGGDGWLDLLKLSTKFARARGLEKPRIVGDREGGRTFYIGGADWRLRVYEKGKEQRGRGNEDAPVDWVRIEFEFKNFKTSKKVASAAASPAALIRMKNLPRAWVAIAAAELDLTDGVEKAARHVGEYEPKVKTLETSAAHGVRQFGPTFMKLAASSIIDQDFQGDQQAAAEVGALAPAHVAACAGEIFAMLSIGAAERVVADGRLNVVETMDEFAVATAVRMQQEYFDKLRDAQRAAEKMYQQAGPVSPDDARREMDQVIKKAVERIEELRAAREEVDAKDHGRERRRERRGRRSK